MSWQAAAEDTPTDARARRAERRAVAQALRGSELDWVAIDACPAWLGTPPAARELLCAHAGAWWRACTTCWAKRG